MNATSVIEELTINSHADSSAGHATTMPRSRYRRNG